VLRKDHLVGGLDLSRPGVEYGPLTRPLVTKDMGPVLYVDYGDTETVRAKAYRDDPNDRINPADIVEIDLVWGERPLKESGSFAYALASHVIEHVPNPIGWLLEIAEALDDDGIIALAVPDKRYTFDIQRPLSTTGELVQSWLEKRVRPSIRQIFDNCRMAVDIPCHEIWAGRTDGPVMMGDIALSLAYGQCVEQLTSDRYIDSHCWVFSPASFLDICEDLIRLKVLPFEIERFVPTSRGELEFFVRFRRAGEDPLATIAAARETIRQAELANCPPPSPPRPAGGFLSQLRRLLPA
jgi:SAM-dependent methyltransferase